MSCCGNFENSPPTPSMSSNIPVDSHESGESQPGPSKQSGRCNHVNHFEDINEYCENILEAIEVAAVDNLPVTNKGKDRLNNGIKNTPGWNEYVQPFHEEAKFWWSIWISSGKPSDPNNSLFLNMRSSKSQYKYAIRRLKKNTEEIQNNTYINSILSGSGNIFREIKKFRGTPKVVSSSIDEIIGSKNIANHFADKYCELYNRGTLGVEFEDLKNRINDKLSEDDLQDVDRVTPELVREALNKMKPNKSDVSFPFSSDCLINAPEALHYHLATLFRIFLIHGKVATILLLCSLIPIVKDNLGDLTSSDNYRAIAKSSLVLKLFDWVVLLSQGDKLSSDELQYGYQKLSSTVMCTWTATNIIGHFNRAGNDVFGALLDCSKAFDMVEWVKLFEELIKREVSGVFLRILLFIYEKQSCDVNWNGRLSFRFGVKNGVRQGAVSSPILFGLYIDKLIKILRRSGIGCTIGQHYYGVLVYADDIILLCPSRMGLQAMINLCQGFADHHNLQFSTHSNPQKSKTKCLHFSKQNLELANIRLNGNPLPWVDSAVHVGNILERNNSFTKDFSMRRGNFIGKVHSILQEFYFANPLVKMKMFSIYATSFYGSNLWNLFNGSCEKLYTAWNIAVRMAFGVPRTTHRYLVEELSEHSHPRILLMARYLKFHETLQKTSKLGVRFLCEMSKCNLRTVHGQNIWNITSETKGELSSKAIKVLKYAPVPAADQWRVGVVKDLLEMKWNITEIDCFTEDTEEVDTILDTLCSS